MATPKTPHEAEWKTRKKRIDPRLDAGGWPRRSGPPSPKPFRTEEEETANGPADYALWIDNQVLGVVEAKKLTVGPQNVLTQAARYARGLDPKVASGNFDGLRAPFLYSTNGEVIWFQDARHPMNRSRRIANLHTASAMKEMFGRDLDELVQRVGDNLRREKIKAHAGRGGLADSDLRVLSAAARMFFGRTMTLDSDPFEPISDRHLTVLRLGALKGGRVERRHVLVLDCHGDKITVADPVGDGVVVMERQKLDAGWRLGTTSAVPWLGTLGRDDEARVAEGRDEA